MLPPTDYDQAITIFSPDGRLYQVEYALELVKRGAPIVGVSATDGAVLAANDALESRLEDRNFSRKIFQIDDHIGAAIAGLSSDARILIDRARLICQQNRLLYDEVVDVTTLVLNLGDLYQTYTQYAGVRPFGVSIIMAGVDVTGSRIAFIDPTGSYKRYKAVAVGRKNDEAIKHLEEGYRDNFQLDDAVRLAVAAVMIASEGKVSAEDVSVAVIPEKNRSFTMLSVNEVEKYV